MQYRVKWVGFELDPLEWTNENDVEGCAALDDWLKQKKMSVNVDGIRELHRLYEPVESANSEF